MPQPVPPRSWQPEYCELDNHTILPGEVFSPPPNALHYVRQARTQMFLHVGGKAGSTEMNLYEIHVYVGAMPDTHLVLMEGETYPMATGPNPIANTSISIPGLGKVGNDGILWAVLPDNSPDKEITPIVTGPGSQFYYFFFSVVKHHLYISATSGLTSADLDQTTPKFCVGEQVTFTQNGVPSQCSSSVGRWVLPPEYVNEAWQVWQQTPQGYGGYVGSVNYRINSNLLTNLPSTSCWYVSGTGGQVNLAADYYFSNGQHAFVITKGNLAVYSPSLKPLSVASPPSQVTIWTYYGGFLTAIGLDQSSSTAISFSTYINSPIAGLAGWTQLLNGKTKGLQSYDTHGNDGLDSEEWYNGGTITVHAANWSVNFLALNDAPWVTCYPNPTTINVDFTDYVRFKPAGNSQNIYVTVGTVIWHIVDAEADYSMGTWTKTGGSVTGPTLQPSTTFPVWLEIYNFSLLSGY